MKKRLLPILFATVLFSMPAICQAQEDSTKLLGLPGDNLDLYAVLTLFQKSKTIEAFEKSLNEEKTGVNNLDLNLDKKVDFIKVVTTQDGEAFAFILKVDVTKTETQDVAVILLNKDEKEKVSLQIVGDEDLYGKDYVIEPKGNSSVTPNPAYTGTDPVKEAVPASNAVVVESAPIVQYVYSPVYVPYTPPYYYGYYPPYFAFFTVMAVGIYHSSCYHYHGGYYGGHYGGGNTVIINNGNRNNINHYNNSRNTSNTVANNKAKGSYGSGSANRQQGNRPSAGTQPANKAGGGNRASNGSASNRPSASTRQSGGVGSSGANRPSTSNFSSSSRPSSSAASRGMSSGGGRSMSGGGGMSRGGGGGRRR
jgi:hypothetical protein